ncbi:hypothetical protein [Natronorubrum sp. FCH18a]|uniref:hypothetical protein n=1 Tax=Natronorubrum sp. FCH18a TaxID=3447018 RepID=UPI003F51A1DB
MNAIPNDSQTVRIRIDDTQAPNGRVVIHVHHADHDGGVRAFFRHRDGDVGASIRSHLRTEVDAELTCVELEDTAGLGLTDAEVLPRALRFGRESPEAVAV